MVFDFSSSNCRFASTPAVFTSLVTRRCSATLPASRPRALGRRGALLRCAGASPGVEAVSVLKFERLGAPDPAAIRNGVIAIGRLEIARLDNDPNFQERGRLQLVGGGGK